MAYNNFLTIESLAKEDGNGGEKMEYGATKLVYSDGKPLWLTADGSFIPARCRNDGSLANEALFLRDPRSPCNPGIFRDIKQGSLGGAGVFCGLRPRCVLVPLL